ncbi:hypothetical protein LX99_01730 [Mucilaginibacter oryzae]|uniref:VCBS repeat protein n=1 Tax=Mucilaginibacter oryzae TaxID=468058 RepID=A0A316HGH2_9SPHI|nr:hypothetical protein [Mucilaginibacter oryzae]PWK79273.1 hypothetical protein LX99_01730 [Mucilaginibacter oryzae]
MRLYFIIFLFLCVCSCSHQPENRAHPQPQLNTGKVKEPTAQKPAPLFGYRFVISGDFDGDGKQEKLTEHFCDSTGKEVNKFYTGDYDYNLKMLGSRKCYSFLKCDSILMDAPPIEPLPNFGLYFLKNEGDLNGDGKDEISLVTNKADWSNLNEYTIMTYRHGKWNTLYWFPIWEWQLPDLPLNAYNFKCFGVQEDVVDTGDLRLLKEIGKFKGLVKKIDNKKLQIVYRSPEISSDTIIVKLKDKHPRL